MRFILLLTAAALIAHADDVPLGPDGKPRFGHSSHGEAFDEGPRQAATLLPGMGAVHFEITTKSEDAKKFFDQGWAQLHGFWYYEAERSFRQVLLLDPDCAIAYTALALSNQNNEKRAADFTAEANKRKASASPREQAWIAAYHGYFADGKSPTMEKRKNLVKALEKLIADFPDDDEARAMLVFHLWENSQKGMPLGSHTAVEALAKTVLAKNPKHPGIHHYLIHLWNYEADPRALGSAAVLGQSAPGIAHMWHMPGHTFTKMQRYEDAAWQQEASARTDHAHMIAARLMPEQIHNYAHNNDWLVENLGYIGRVRDAADLARNMIELPRLAPGHVLVGKDGTPEARTGFAMGRKRLLDLLLAWGHWDELLSLDGTSYMESSEDALEDAVRLKAMGIAAFSSNQLPKGEEKLAALELSIKRIRDNRVADADAAEAAAKEAKKSADDIAKAMTDALKKSNERVAKLEAVRAELQLYRALAENKPAGEVKPLIDASKDIPPLRSSRIYLKLGDGKKAQELAERAVKDGKGQVLPLANLADIQWRNGDKDSARDTFQKLRPLCAQADLGEMAFARLQPIAATLDAGTDWRPKLEWPEDSGQRPPLASLGPFRWTPSMAPAWQATDERGKVHTSVQHAGQPMLVVFYLGGTCSHCIEQLNRIGPVAKDFAAAGIQIIAVSPEKPDELNFTFVQAEGAMGFPFPIVADPSLAMFKSWRTYDDFDKQPLHGTFLVDAQGRIRWQDISFQPFTKIPWLLGECKRLLALPPVPPSGVSAR